MFHPTTGDGAISEWWLMILGLSSIPRLRLHWETSPDVTKQGVGLVRVRVSSSKVKDVAPEKSGPSWRLMRAKAGDVKPIKIKRTDILDIARSNISARNNIGGSWIDGRHWGTQLYSITFLVLLYPAEFLAFIRFTYVIHIRRWKIFWWPFFYQKRPMSVAIVNTFSACGFIAYLFCCHSIYRKRQSGLKH